MRLGNRRQPAGWARETPEKREDMRHALRTMAELAAAGLFLLLRDATWSYERHFESPRDWAECLERPWCGGAETDAALIDSAGTTCEGRIVLTEENVAQIFERS